MDKKRSNYMRHEPFCKTVQKFNLKIKIKIFISDLTYF